MPNDGGGERGATQGHHNLFELKLVHSTNRFKRAQAKKRSGNCFFHYLAQINSFNFSRFVHQKYPHIMLVKKVEKTTIHLTEALQDSSTF